MRALLPAVTALLITVTLTGCVNTDAPVAPSPTSASTPSASTTVPATPPSDVVEAPPEIPDAGFESVASAVDAAEHVMTLFARPDLEAHEWIDGLYPFLTQQGGFAYEGTDPSLIPCHQVTGPGVVIGEASEYALIVQVPTDAGLYNVSLTRPTADAAWQTDRIRPAQA